MDRIKELTYKKNALAEDKGNRIASFLVMANQDVRDINNLIVQYNIKRNNPDKQALLNEIDIKRQLISNKYPASFLAQMSDFSEHNNGLVPYLDIPLQHSHPDVLKRMKRPAGGEKTLHRIEQWREICPDLIIRSTFIAGFPGESKEEFEDLLNFIQLAQLDRVGCFAYSPVKGAKANELSNPVDEEIREERRAEFMRIAEQVSTEKLKRYIGKRIRILVDSVHKDGGIGRTFADAPEIDGLVYIDKPDRPSKRYRTGEFIKATVLDTKGHDLIVSI